jgi:hypothetical protein
MKRDELYNLRVRNIRRVNGRIVCDLINGDGKLVLSGNVDWVQNVSSQRNYEIENADEANAKLDALMRNWGVY